MSSNKPVGNNASSFHSSKHAIDEHARGESTERKDGHSGAQGAHKDRAADGQKWPSEGGAKDAFTTGSEHHHHHKAHGHKGHHRAHSTSDKPNGSADSAAGSASKKPVSSGSAASTKTGGSLDTGGNVGVATQGKSAARIDLKVPSSDAEQVSSTPSSATTLAPTASTSKAKSAASTPSASPAAAPKPAAAEKAKSPASGAAIGGAKYSNGTPFDGSTGPIGAKTAGPNEPTVTVKNNSNTPRYYKIEGGAGTDPEKLNENVFVLQPGQTATVNPGAGFDGAITDQGSSPTGAANTGTRQEINFGQAGHTWYDSDDERTAPEGAPNSTLGPTDTSLLADDGRNSLVSNLYAYQTPGSVAGQTTSETAAQDDLKNRVISTQKMTITSS